MTDVSDDVAAAIQRVHAAKEWLRDLRRAQRDPVGRENLTGPDIREAARAVHEAEAAHAAVVQRWMSRPRATSYRTNHLPGSG